MKKNILIALGAILLASCQKEGLPLSNTSTQQTAALLASGNKSGSSIKSSNLPDTTKIKQLGLLSNVSMSSSNLTSATSEGSASIDVQLGMSDTSYSLSKINGWDFTKLALPFALPHWSDTVALNDWMPDSTLYLISGNIDPMNGWPYLYAAFKNRPADDSYMIIKKALFATMGNYGLFPGDPGNSTNYASSLNSMKWISAIYMQNQIINHNGKIGILNYVDNDAWVTNAAGVSTRVYNSSDNQMGSSLEPVWLVGDIYRRSLELGGSSVLPDAVHNAAIWYYAGWITNYGMTTSTAGAPGTIVSNNEYQTKSISQYISRYGYAQLATAIALKSMVNRPKNVYNMYDDLRSVSAFGEPNYYNQAMSFGLKYILNNLTNNYQSMILNNDDKTAALSALNEALGYITFDAAQSPNKTQFITQINQIISIVQGM